MSDGRRGTRGQGMPLRRGVHLLLEHPLVGGRDGVLRPAEDLRPRPLRLAERELGDRAADPPLDPLLAVRDLVVALALAPLLRPVRVADGHADDRDRRVDTAQRDHSRDPTSGPDDHLATDLQSNLLDHAQDISLRNRRVGPHNKIRSAQCVKVSCVIRAIERGVEQLAQQLGCARWIHLIDGVRGFGGSHVMCFRADAADAVR